MTAPTATGMTEAAVLLRLSAWMSPAFPTGGYAWSAGLENAVAESLIADAAGLEAWLSALLAHGGARNDAALFARAWRTAESPEELEGLAQLALALAPSAERHAETAALGAAFLAAARPWLREGRIPDPDLPWPVAAGAVCRLGGAPLEASVCLFLQAFVSSQLQAAIRLSIAGQRDAARMLAALEAAILAAAADACAGRPGSFVPLADLASFNHETQTTRLFQS